MVVERTGGPGLSDPRLGPPVIDWQRICAVEYQEGATSGAPISCACSTFAIGLCAGCSQPVCGIHSGLHPSGRRLCEHCWRAADEIAAAEAAEAERKAGETYETQLRLWRKRVIASLQGVERTEQLVRAAAGLTTGGGYGQGLGMTNWTEVRNVLGEVPEVSVQQIARWFVGRAAGPPPDRIGAELPTLFGGVKTKQIRVWRFKEASASSYEFMDAARGNSDLAFAPDGGVFLSGPMGQYVPIDPLPAWVRGPVRILPHGYRQIASELGLTPIPAPPSR